MRSLIIANLWSRPTRTIISIVAVAIGVTLMLIIGGIVSGTLDDYLARTMGVGADFILQPTGGSVFYAFTNAALSTGLAKALQEVPGIAAVAPVLSKFSSSDFGLIFGIDLDSYNKFSGRLKILKGRESLDGDEVIVDDIYAKAQNINVGMPLTLLNHQFTISGICRSGAVVRVFVPLKTLQEMNGTPNKATIMFIKAVENTNVAEVEQRLHNTYPELAIIRTSDPSMLLANTRLPGLKEFRFTIILISVLLSFLVILLAMYTTIYERTREIGILKSLGASRRFIVSMILKESAMICALGVMLGIGVSVLIREVIISVFPTLQVAMSYAEVFRGCILGMLGGTTGALYPAVKAAKMDPVRALSYE
jgi:putative ABC transport system permease protein